MSLLVGINYCLSVRKRFSNAGAYVVLTSGATISAGDHCAMYLKELPYVRLVGENTNGIFSPMWGATLPNGWQPSLSNGQNFDARRTNYEGRGVPVDLPVVHHQADTKQGWTWASSRHSAI